MLDMRPDDVYKSFLDQFAAFNCVGISERVEELESWSVPSSEERVSIMLDCIVDSARSKAFVRRLRARYCVDRLGAATQKLRCRVVELMK